MRALILAAGRGERMRPLTDTTPKPLLAVGGKPLIVWHLERLRRAGIDEVVINLAWLGDRIEAALGDGAAFGMRLRYSKEGEALETAGGIARALPLLTDDGRDSGPFLVVSGDTWSDYDYGRAHAGASAMLAAGDRCRCVMVRNPDHHGHGDFRLERGRLQLASAPGPDTDSGRAPGPATAPGAPALPTLTYAGIGLYLPAGFAEVDPNRKAALRPWLDATIRAGLAGGEFHPGEWHDIGTVARLEALDRALRARVGPA